MGKNKKNTTHRMGNSVKCEKYSLHF